MKSALRILSTLTVLGLAVPAFAADAKTETTKTVTTKKTTKKTAKKTAKKTDTKPQASDTK